MKKPILLLQFRTNKSLQHERDCILDKGSFRDEQVKSINVLDNNTKLPKPKDLGNYSAVIFGGSGEVNISEWDKQTKKRIEQLKPLVVWITTNDYPSLFICLGHQLLAHFLGSEVKQDPNQKEVGTFKIKLSELGKNSLLFKDIPDEFYVVEGHKESVMSLPEKAKLLALSERCNIQAMQFGNNVFSTQFHAELDKQGLYERLKLFPSYMEGKTKEEIMKDFAEIPYAIKILKNWKKYIAGA
jgi:GMP synthase (glutamine-hydrolysing)